MILVLAILLSAAPTNAKVCKTLDTVDFKKYVGRWYNVYYDRFDDIFASSECASAYYTQINETYISVNNSGTKAVRGKTVFLGTANIEDKTKPAQLRLHLDGVSRDASYWICEVGPDTYYDYWYEYAIVTDSSGFTLFVLARDPERFNKMFDDHVRGRLEELGYKGPLFGPIFINQTGLESPPLPLPVSDL